MALLPEVLNIVGCAKVYDNSGEHPKLVFFKRAEGEPLLLNREIRHAWVEERIVAPMLAQGYLNPLLTFR